MNDWTEFSSRNLNCQLIGPQHRSAVVALYSDPKVTQHIDLISSNMNAESAFSRILKANEKPQSAGVYWAIFTSDKTFVGLQGLTFDKEEQHRAEIGIMFFPKYARSGMATEVLAAMISFAFTVMPITSLFAHFDRKNSAVKQLATRLNFDQVTDCYCSYSKRHWQTMYQIDNSLRFNC